MDWKVSHEDIVLVIGIIALWLMIAKYGFNESIKLVLENIVTGTLIYFFLRKIHKRWTMD